MNQSINCCVHSLSCTCCRNKDHLYSISINSVSQVEFCTTSALNRGRVFNNFPSAALGLADFGPCLSACLCLRQKVNRVLLVTFRSFEGIWCCPSSRFRWPVVEHSRSSWQKHRRQPPCFCNCARLPVEKLQALVRYLTLVGFLSPKSRRDQLAT